MAMQQFNNGVIDLGVRYFVEPIFNGLKARGITITMEELMQFIEIPRTTEVVSHVTSTIHVDHVPRGRKPKEQPAPGNGCIYIIQRGIKENIGKACDKPRHPGHDYCRGCLNKAGVKKLLKQQPTGGSSSESTQNGLVDPDSSHSYNAEPYDVEHRLYQLTGHNILIFWDTTPDEKGDVPNPMAFGHLLRGGTEENPEKGDKITELSEDEKVLAEKMGFTIYDHTASNMGLTVWEHVSGNSPN